MRFRDKVRRPKRPVVVYEILPPREKDGTLDSYAEKISSLLSQTHIDAINIPEVHDENERGESGNLDEFFRETNFPRDVGEERESNEFDVLAGKRERIWTGERDVFRDIDRDDIGRVLTLQGDGDEGF